MPFGHRAILSFIFFFKALVPLLMHLFRQRRPVERENRNGNLNAATREGDDVERQSSLLLPSAEDDLERSYATRERSRERLSMAVNHLTAFVLIFTVCTQHVGLGWAGIPFEILLLNLHCRGCRLDERG